MLGQVGPAHLLIVHDVNLAPHESRRQRPGLLLDFRGGLDGINGAFINGVRGRVGAGQLRHWLGLPKLKRISNKSQVIPCDICDIPTNKRAMIFVELVR